MKPVRLKQDPFRKARGGHSRFLRVSCEGCGAFIALYQKDGPGPLKRMYLDRIFAPESIVGLQNKVFHTLSNLTCETCDRVVGVPFIYQKEQRPSFRLFEGSVKKKITKIPTK